MSITGLSGINRDVGGLADAGSLRDALAHFQAFSNNLSLVRNAPRGPSQGPASGAYGQTSEKFEGALQRFSQSLSGGSDVAGPNDAVVAVAPMPSQASGAARDGHAYPPDADRAPIAADTASDAEERGTSTPSGFSVAGGVEPVADRVENGSAIDAFATPGREKNADRAGLAVIGLSNQVYVGVHQLASGGVPQVDRTHPGETFTERAGLAISTFLRQQMMA